MSARHALFGILALALTACPGGGPEWPDSWEISHSVDASVGAFLSVWGPSPTEVYAVGGNPDAGVIFRFDGEDWSRDETVPADVPLLNWIDGTSGEVWVVGNEGVALHQTATGWERVDTGIDAPLWGVWGAAPDDLWAVGGDTAMNGSKPRLAHYDGVAWAEVELPAHNRPESTRALFKVWGTAADNVFAVGMDGLILHYDGAAWAQSPFALTNDLISLWGSGPDDIVAVGGRSNGVVARWDGASWSGELIGAPASSDTDRKISGCVSIIDHLRAG